MIKPPEARKLAVGHLSVRQLRFWLLVVSSSYKFQNACMVYKHAVVAAFLIYAQYGEDRVPTSSGNHGKPGKSLKKVPCMEKSWNLKKTE